MKDYFFLLPLLVFASVACVFAYRYLRYGSLLGMTVGARVLREVGKVEAGQTQGLRRILEVHVLEPEPGQPAMVAVGETTRGKGSWKFNAFRLSADQARQLARLLEQAAGG